MSIVIRRTRPEDAPHLPAIEVSAGEAFRAIADLARIADHDVMSVDDHLDMIADGACWVAETQVGTLIGFLCADRQDDDLHIWELAVRHDRQRHGAGRDLVAAAVAHARAEKLAGVTLTTFRNVAWNELFYARLGFVTLADAGARLGDILQQEAAYGLPRRCAMRMTLTEKDTDMRIAPLVIAAQLAVGCAPAQPPVATAPTAALMTWPDLLNRPRPAPTQRVTYGPAATDVADLWLPDGAENGGAGPFPVVLMVHGGCWQKSIADRTIMDWAAEALRADGIAVWNIEYRGVDEAGGGYPGTFLDAARAADALRDLGAKYHLNTDRVVAFGHSAGGHLALWLAARPRLPASSELAAANPLRIVGVVNSGGLADLKASAPVTEHECLAAIMDQLTGAPDRRRPDVFADTSPAELLPLGVRQISVNGDRDRIAPPVLGEGYTSRANAAGDAADTVIVAHTGHVELIAPGTAAFAVEVARIRELLGLPAHAP